MGGVSEAFVSPGGYALLDKLSGGNPIAHELDIYERRTWCRVCGTRPGVSDTSRSHVNRIVDKEILFGSDSELILERIGSFVRNWPKDARPTYGALVFHRRHLDPEALMARARARRAR